MFWRCLAVAAALTTAPAAKADYWTPHADIVCSRVGDIALIRFGGAEDENPTIFRKLPRRIDGGLSRARATTQTDCALPNGWHLRLRDGQRQAFAYGMGGADPPAFFSLWINRRRIFSAKEFKPGYGMPGTLLTALVIRPNRLTWCRAADDDAAQRCVGETFKLGKRYRLDAAEYPANGRKWKVGTLLATRIDGTESFCRRYVETMRAKMFDDVAFSFALFGHEHAPFAVDLGGRQIPGSDILQANVDIAPGVRRLILLKHGESHFFDGDVIFVLPQGIDASKLARQIDFHSEKAGDDPDRPPLSEAPGWTRLVGGVRNIYPGVSPRYVHFIPERIDGRLYFLANPANVENRPTAILLGLKSAGGARVMCRIQRVEPHF